MKNQTQNAETREGRYVETKHVAINPSTDCFGYSSLRDACLSAEAERWSLVRVVMHSPHETIAVFERWPLDHDGVAQSRRITQADKAQALIGWLNRLPIRITEGQRRTIVRRAQSDGVSDG